MSEWGYGLCHSSLPWSSSPTIIPEEPPAMGSVGMLLLCCFTSPGNMKWKIHIERMVNIDLTMPPATNHYLSQFWLFIKEVSLRSPQGKFRGTAQDINHQTVFLKTTHLQLELCYRNQWVKGNSVLQQNHHSHHCVIWSSWHLNSLSNLIICPKAGSG